MNRSEALKKADDYVSKDRNTQYGEPENAFAAIAELWNTYLDTRRGHQVDASIDAYDVSNMMLLLKVARLAVRPGNSDSAIDAAGYAACSAEILSDINMTREPVPAPVPKAPPHPPAHSASSKKYGFDDA